DRTKTSRARRRLGPLVQIAVRFGRYESSIRAGATRERARAVSQARRPVLRSEDVSRGYFFPPPPPPPPWASPWPLPPPFPPPWPPPFPPAFTSAAFTLLLFPPAPPAPRRTPTVVPSPWAISPRPMCCSLRWFVISVVAWLLAWAGVS